MVTTEDAIESSDNIDLTTLGRDGETVGSSHAAGPSAAYSVTISSEVRANRLSRPEFKLPTSGNVQIREPSSARPRTRRRAAFEANTAAWSYARCAILFFTAILITWIPSSANRVFSVVHPGEASIPLEFMSAIVLPLQGFWNAVIYIVTSWSACKYFFSEMRHRSKSSEKRTSNSHSGGITGRNPGYKRPSRKPKHLYDTESMTELAVPSRGNSDDESKQQAP